MIRTIVLATDGGAMTAAMGAVRLRKKVAAAGLHDVTVITRSVDHLTDGYDLVISHRDHTERARAKSPSAQHVSIEGFRSSSRYDEAVALVVETNSADPAPAPAPPSRPAPAEAEPAAALLSTEAIVLDVTGDRDGAITRAGELLVAVGAVEESYVAAMHERETSVSTYMGNGLAIPHGTNASGGSVRRPAFSFARYAEPVDWHGEQVRYVVGIAGVGQEHLALLGQIAEVFLDDAQLARLDAATSSDDVLAVLGSAG